MEADDKSKENINRKEGSLKKRLGKKRRGKKEKERKGKV